jgi:hypothetical protein
MKSNCFWQIPQFKKFRIIFEDASILVGATEENQYQIFRKDSPYLRFSEQEALEISLDFQAARETSPGIMAESI